MLKFLFFINSPSYVCFKKRIIFKNNTQNFKKRHFKKLKKKRSYSCYGCFFFSWGWVGKDEFSSQMF